MSRSKDGSCPGIMATVALSLLGCVVVILVILLCITAITALSSCTAHPRKPELKPMRRMTELDQATATVVMNLVYMKSDPNIFKVKELDPFRRQ